MPVFSLDPRRAMPFAVVLCFCALTLSCGELPTGFPSQDKQGFCDGDPDCSAGSKCVNTICVPTAKGEGSLPWSGLPQCNEGSTRGCPDPNPTPGTCPLTGLQTCTKGRWGPCKVPQRPTELCGNDKDDDCDGVVDEGCPCHYKGKDKGVCAQAKRDAAGTCQVPDGYNDDEICDGKDNNCDGYVDVDGDSQKPLSRSCYTGPPDTENKGLCEPGEQLCRRGQWGPCEDQVLPKKEECDQVDNDCNGTTDENCDCKAGDVRPCGVDAGICTQGEQKCVGGKWSAACDGGVPAGQEICNGKDDDCDGHTDEADQLKAPPCAKQEGVCKGSSQQCKRGQWQACTAFDYSRHSPRKYDRADYSCDGLDNDCNGKIDDGFRDDVLPCNVHNKAGLCALGKKRCVQGAVICVSNTQPVAEECNGKDDDCDGTIDEKSDLTGKGPPCNKQAGVCKGSTRPCIAGRWLTLCDYKAHNSSFELFETRCDGKDNDCDGAVDETFSTKGQKCTTPLKGPCSNGRRVCENGAVSCKPYVSPKTEQCNGLDDDCDGTIDNNLSGPCQCKNGESQSCYTGSVGCTKAGASYNCNYPCQKGSQKCVGNTWGSCNNQTLPATETCNNLDDDCDGQTDEDLLRSCYTGPTGTEGKGPCRPGSQSCSAGKWGPCNGQVKPQPEVCNGTDDDCNGQIDDKPTDVGSLCKTQLPGICEDGSLQCQAGQRVCIQKLQPQKEQCNGKDDNCNGAVDDGIRVSSPCKVPGKEGVCSDGLSQCLNGRLLCSQTRFPSTEACRDGKDNDCDGYVDEICGDTFAYAVVRTSGTLEKGSRLSSSFAGLGKVALNGSSLGALPKPKCSQQVLIATPATATNVSIAYACSGDAFHVYTGLFQAGGAVAGNTPFSAVVPAGGAYGVIRCSGSAGNHSCTLSKQKNASSPTVTNDVIFFQSPECNSVNRPIFLTIHRSGIAGYIWGRSEGGGKCAVQITDAKGALKPNIPFSFWIPPSSSATWATVDSSGKKVVAQATLAHSDGLSWSATWDASQTPYHSLVGYASWANVSAILTMARAPKNPGTHLPRGSTATPIRGNSAPFAKIYHYTLDTSNRKVSSALQDGFFVLFVQ